MKDQIERFMKIARAAYVLDQDGRHVPLDKYFVDAPDPELDRTLSRVNDAINQPGD